MPNYSARVTLQGKTHIRTKRGQSSDALKKAIIKQGGVWSPTKKAWRFAGGVPADFGGSPTPKKATVKKATPKKATVKKATVKKVTPKKAAVRKSPAKKVTVKKVAAKKVTVKKVAAKKATVKKVAAKKATVKKVAAVPKAKAKRPLNAYVMWTMERRPSLKEAYPELSPTALMSIMAQEWKNFDAEKKDCFKKLNLATRAKVSSKN
jgi:HMG (high mobility group) box